MPNQAHSGIVGIPWHRCQRCGTDTRVSDLVWQDGILVCTNYKCRDKRPINDQSRQRLIQEVLSSGQDAPPAEILLVGEQAEPEDF